MKTILIVPIVLGAFLSSSNACSVTVCNQSSESLNINSSSLGSTVWLGRISANQCNSFNHNAATNDLIAQSTISHHGSMKFFPKWCGFVYNICGVKVTNHSSKTIFAHLPGQRRVAPALPNPGEAHADIGYSPYVPPFEAREALGSPGETLSIKHRDTNEVLYSSVVLECPGNRDYYDVMPTTNPTLSPTGSPSLRPSLSPTHGPTTIPTKAPSLRPTKTRTLAPTLSPSQSPTASPTQSPTKSPQQQQQALAPIRINAGSTLPNDTWLKDTEYVTQGAMFEGCGVFLFCSQRYGKTVEFSIPVVKGQNYKVRFLFYEVFCKLCYTGVYIHVVSFLSRSEIYSTADFAAGARVFDILIDNEIALADIDIFGEVGFGVWHTVEMEREASAVAMQIALQAKSGSAMINAIELLPIEKKSVEKVVEPVSKLFVERINCGGPDYVDTQQQLWSSDKFFTGGSSSMLTTTGDVVGTEDDNLYYSERFGSFGYEIPVPKNGSYRVTLMVAEIVKNQARQRLFDVNVEGHTYQSLDLFTLGGFTQSKALVFSGELDVTDGSVSIQFSSSGIGDPKLSAIQVEEM